MAQKKFKCTKLQAQLPRCPAHLARHLSTTHASKKAKAAAKRKRRESNRQEESQGHPHAGGPRQGCPPCLARYRLALVKEMQRCSRGLGR